MLSSWSGTLNLSALTRGIRQTGFGVRGTIQASRTNFGGINNDYLTYRGMDVSVSRLGTNSTVFTGAVTGDGLSYLTDRRFLYLDTSYVSGTELAGTLRIENATLADIGIAPQTFTASWGSGANADSITHIYGQAAPLPLPASIATLGLGLGGLAALRRRSRRKAN